MMATYLGPHGSHVAQAAGEKITRIRGVDGGSYGVWASTDLMVSDAPHSPAKSPSNLKV